MKWFQYHVALLIILFNSALFAGWSEPMRLTYRGNELMPQVVARNDTVHVVWAYDIHDAQICYMRSTNNGQTWGNIINLVETGHIGYYPRVSITDNAIWVCWFDNNLESIGITSSTNGGSWSTPIYKYTIDSQRWEGLGFGVGNDTIFLVYLASTRDSTGLKPYKLLSSFDSGQSWQPLRAFAHTNTSNLDLRTYYCQGVLLVAVSTVSDTSLGGYHIIGYTSSDAGQTWSDTMWISPRQWYTAQQPCISCNQTTGQFAVGYMDYRYQQYAFYGDIFIRLSENDTMRWGHEAQATNNHTAVSPSIYFYNTEIGAVWSDKRYTNLERDQLVFNRSMDSGISWEGEIRLTETINNSWNPCIFVDSSTKYLVWREELSGNIHGRDIYFMKCTPDSSDIIDDKVIIPSSFSISAYPNPFNSTTKITFSDNQGGEVEIYDISGRLIKSLSVKDRSEGSVIWDAKDGLGQPLASGIYIAKTKTPRGVCTAKLVYIK